MCYNIFQDIRTLNKQKVLVDKIQFYDIIFISFNINGVENKGKLMDQNADLIAKAIRGSLSIIEQDRERKIVEKRFGLNGQKETLEQIGETLSVTRERVRQLEKVILIRLRVAAKEGNIPDLAAAEKIIIRNLAEIGRIARTNVLADKLYGRPTSNSEKAAISFLGEISSSLTTLAENDKYFSCVAIADTGD